MPLHNTGIDNTPTIAKAWSRHWPNLIALFDYPDDIRKAIYTTNAIESLNSVVRKAVHKRKIFPSDRSAIKVVYLAIEAALEGLAHADPSLEGDVESPYD